MDRRIRVLFIIDELDIGGTEQQILELVKRLDRDTYAPMVCCFRPGRVSQEIEAAGVPVFTLRKRATLDVNLIAGLVRLMRRERIDLVQTYLFTANTWGRLAAILAGIPIIVSSERNVDMWEERFKPVIGRWLDRWTHRTIGNSRAVKDYLVRKGLRPARVQVIYNGVDPGRFEEPVTPGVTKSELGIPPHCSVVCFLARLEPQKDPRTFLQAAAMVAQRLPAVSFLVIGGGSMQSDLEREAQALGLGGRIVFTGPRRDVARLLAACDLSVMSSVKEGMSNTIMESMAAGKPMVATRVGGNAELIADGETGFLVPPRDPAALADAIQRILEDPALAKAMGLQARARIAQQFSVEAMVQATKQLYDDAVQSLLPRRAASASVRDEEPGRGRIALVASQFPRHVDAYFLREISGLASRGFRFRIFSLRGFDSTVGHGAAKAFLADTVYAPFLLSWRVLLANARFALRTPRRYFGALLALVSGALGHPRALVRALAVFPKTAYFAERIALEGIRHIHANWASHPAMSAWVMSRLTGASWSFAGHASDIYLDRAMLREKIQAAKFVVTCTRHNKDYLAGIGGEASAAKITVSYHGVDLDRFKPVPRRADGVFRILTAGTLRECKGLPDLIEACRVLDRLGITFECTIVGDGPDRRSLERSIGRAGLGDRVRTTGFLSQEDLIPLYQQADVVVLPALSATHFGIPNILLEALAVETPVICTPLPSLSEAMEHGTHGLFVPEQSPDALAAALESMARNPERCRAMGAAGRRKIEELFDAEKNTAALAALFRSGTEQRADLS
jgi:colanic acid/amylovoran biosynthesis glycosyltransferase